MLTTINMTTSSQDMDRFENKEQLSDFYHSLGIDGIELMMVGGMEIPEKIIKSDVLGIHLNFPPYWYDFWKNNKEALQQIFGTEEIWQQYYGGADGSALVKKLKAELAVAEKLHAKYVVFHISESTPEECLTYKILHADEEICDAACEIINQALDGDAYHFEFLCENLWWSGLNMTRPKVTKRLMDGIHYEKKGIMLDTGHLLHTNRTLRTQEEAVEFIHQILDQHGELCRYIRGIHLQQSLSGEYVEEYLKNPIELVSDYMNVVEKVFLHIFKIDQHQPFTAAGVFNLVERISPQ